MEAYRTASKQSSDFCDRSARVGPLIPLAMLICYLFILLSCIISSNNWNQIAIFSFCVFQRSQFLVLKMYIFSAFYWRSFVLYFIFTSIHLSLIDRRIYLSYLFILIFQSQASSVDHLPDFQCLPLYEIHVKRTRAHISEDMASSNSTNTNPLPASLTWRFCASHGAKGSKLNTSSIRKHLIKSHALPTGNVPVS